MINKKKWKTELIDILFIMIAITFVAFLDSNNIGIYFDSVFPDYLSVHVLNSKIDNPTMNFPYIGIPLLGQLYHGTVTVFLQIIVVGLLGKASLFSLRLCNAIWCSLACISMYFLMRKIHIRRTIVLFSEVCLIFNIALFMILKTQYYIKVPGTAFTFLAFLAFVSGKKREKSFRYALISGLLAGLAFYSYFIYLFFVPAYIYLYLKEKKIYNLFCFFGGFCVGCLGYFIGYSELLIFIIDMPLSEKKVYLVITIFLLMSIAMLFIIISYKDIWFKKQGGGIFLTIIECLLCLVEVLFVGVVICKNNYIIKEFMSSQLNSLNVSGYKIGLWRRIRVLVEYTIGIFTDVCETRVLGKHITILSEFFLIAIIILLCYLVFLMLIDKGLEETCKKIIKSILAFLISFYCMALFFASRMGVQHFVPIFFIGFIILGYGTEIVFSRTKRIWENRLGYVVSVVIMLFPIEINCINLLNIHNYLKSNDCVNYFSKQINDLAYEALNAYDMGEEEFYIFPEWGIMAGFNYLTNNQINYSLSLENIDQNRIGRKVKICYFDEDNTEEYLSMLNNYDISDVIMYEYLSPNSESFIKIIEVPKSDSQFAWRSGKYDDNWIGKSSELVINNESSHNKKVKISYYTINEMDGVTVRIFSYDREIGIYSLKSGGGEIIFDVEPGVNTYKIDMEKSYNPAREGYLEDRRELTIIVNSIELV